MRMIKMEMNDGINAREGKRCVSIAFWCTAYDDCTSIKMHRPLFAAQSALEFQRVRAFGTGEPCLLCRLLALPGPWNINYGLSVFVLLHATFKQHRPIVFVFLALCGANGAAQMMVSGQCVKELMEVGEYSDTWSCIDCLN